jgi:predicted nuclease of predicted toxin-antitoxin system
MTISLRRSNTQHSTWTILSFDRRDVRFLIDAQLPPGLAQHLVDLGHEAVHVGDVGLLAARDQDIWQHAVAIGAVLVTKDEDFVTMRALSTAAGPPVIWVRVGNATRRILIQRFSAILPKLLAALERGETVVQIPD